MVYSPGDIVTFRNSLCEILDVDEANQQYLVRQVDGTADEFWICENEIM